MFGLTGIRTHVVPKSVEPALACWKMEWAVAREAYWAKMPAANRAELEVFIVGYGSKVR